jgi:uncharacterized protein
MDSQLVPQVMAVFAAIDQQTAAVQQTTGLQCPPGCGKCCQSPTVEVTVLDCIPYALELVQQEQAEAVLQQLVDLQGADLQGDSQARADLPADRQRTTCVFYQADPAIPGNGRCGIYPWRPALCRLFGFAATRNKYGQPELAACVEHKAMQPEMVAQTQARVAAGLAVPVFTQIAEQMMAIAPNLGTEYLPINQAWQRAIEHVGLWWQFRGTT